MNCKTFLLFGLACRAAVFACGQSSDAQSVSVYLAAKASILSGSTSAGLFTFSTAVENPDGTFATVAINATVPLGGNNVYSPSTPVPQTVTLDVGRVYWLNIGTTRTSNMTLNVNPPAGYEVHVIDSNSATFDNVTREYKFPTVINEQGWDGHFGTTLGLCVTPEVTSTAGGQAGTSTSLSTSGAAWRIYMGYLPNGLSAGYLEMNDRGRAAAGFTDAFNPDALMYSQPSPEVIVFGVDTGGSRKIFAYEAGVWIQPLNSPSIGYTVSFYHNSQVTDNSVTGPSFSGTPFMVYTIQQDGSSPTNLKITRAATGPTQTITKVATIQRTGSAWPNYTFTIADWHTDGQAALVSATTALSAGTGGMDHNESVTLASTAGGTSQVSSAQYVSKPYGEVPVFTQSGAAAPETRTPNYYETDSTLIGAYARPKLVTGNNGSWEGYEYFSSTYSISGGQAQFNNTGMVLRSHRPYLNTAAPAPTDDLSLSTAGVVTTYQYQNDTYSIVNGLALRPSDELTQIGGVTVAHAATGYVDNSTLLSYAGLSLPLVTATRTDYADSGTPLTTITKYFREYTVSTQQPPNQTAGQYFGTDAFWRKQVHSVQKPDGTKQVYAYQRGTYSSGSFTVNTSTSPFGVTAGVPWHWADRTATQTPASASSIAIITGTANASNSDGTSNGSPLTSYNGYPIDSVYLVDGKSTLNVTIRDLSALVRRTETWAWVGGAFHLVSSEDLTYDLANNLISKVSSTGATYSATYDGGRKTSETDAAGITINYNYDDAGRVSYTIKTGVSGQADLRADYTYDAAGRTITEDIHAVGGSEHLITSHTYDDAGRLGSETKPGLGTTSYTYTPVSDQVSVSLPNGGTRVEVSYPDGQKSQVTGTGVVPQYFSYDVQSGGVRHTLVRSGTTSSGRVQESWTDWLGRTTKTSHPSLVGSSPGSFVENKVYDPTTGLLSKSTRTDAGGNRLYADTLYVYDSLGQLFRTFLDIDNTGLLTLGGSDRITETNQFYQLVSSNYWLTKQTITYPKTSNPAPQVVNTTQQRLTGLGGTFQGETVSTDIDGNVTDTTTTVNRAASTTTVSTTATGYTNPQSVVSINGLVSTKTGFDGLTYTTHYDALSRPYQSIDPQNRTTTTSYVSGTALPYQVTDPATNIVATYSYDGAGRVTAVANAASKNVRSEYNTLDQVVHQWGEATYPVEYVYDPIYGQRTELHTYQAEGNWSQTLWPTGNTPTSVTKWAFDDATGLLLSKTNVVSPTNQVVTMDYNARGQTWHHVWARGVTATLSYDSQTGELLSKAYSDGTPTVSYTYTRAGLPNTVSDATGLQQFNYDPNQVQRLSSLGLSAYYGSRTQTLSYDSIHRPNGFVLGSSELTQTITYSGLGWFDHIDTTRSGQSTLTYTYTYKTNSPLLAGYTSGSFAAIRDYETNRDLVTKVDSQWSSVSQTRYDALYNTLAQRSSVKQSGNPFADFGNSTYYQDGYDDRGELTSSTGYLGTDPTQTTSPLPGRNFAYGYDAIGNRKSTSRTGTSGTADTYTPNALNQYDSRQNHYVYAAGTVASGTVSVGASGGVVPPAISRQGNYWFAQLQLDNAGHPKHDTINLVAAIPGTTTDTIKSQSITTQIPAASQSFVYDADGNLTTDGIWNYQWDAENRLTNMTTTTTAANYGVAARVLTFQYDYLDRRVQKRVTDSAGTTEYYSRRYLYDGWNLVAEFAAPGGTTIGSIARAYTWGLDLVGSRTTTGGVGALLQIADYATGKNYLPTYDTNGNIAALLNASTGAIAAAYEYSPYGEVLRAALNDSDIADNPVQFSTKFTDAETGLVYYGHRYYSPSLGRFLNRDPIEESGGVNLYGFALNDPVDKWDVLGNAALAGSGSEDPRRPDQVSKMEEAKAKFVAAAVSLGHKASDPVVQAVAQTFATATASLGSEEAGIKATNAIYQSQSAVGSANSTGSLFSSRTGGNSTTTYSPSNPKAPNRIGTVTYGPMQNAPLHPGEFYNANGSINQDGAIPDFWAGICYRFFCGRKFCRIDPVRIFGVWPDWARILPPNCRVVVIFVMALAGGR